MKKNTDFPAFPTLKSEPFTDPNGLTKREYFAALAMQGLLASSCNIEIINEKILAEKAVMCADETLELLKK